MKFLSAFTFIILTSLFFSCTKSDDSNDTSEYVYADTTDYGPNLLDTSVTKFYGSEFSFSAKIPKDGKLTVKLKKTSGGNWFIASGTTTNWAVSSYDASTESQTFTAITDETTCDLQMEVLSGTYTLEYFENKDSDPTRVKEFEI